MENAHTPYQQFIGTKVIQAMPMSAETAIERGYRVETAEDGYEVVYPGGYKSWSPKGAFESSYRPYNGMTFGLAIEAMRLGKKVSRAGWNGKGMWLRLVEPYSDFGMSDAEVERVTDATLLPWIGMKTADNKFVPWLASQTDMLADDWGILEEAPQS